MPTYPGNRKDDKINSTPITPMVTGIDYPSIEDASTARETYRPPRPKGKGFYTHPNIGGSTIEDVEPPADAQSLDLIWGTIRQEKEKKMAKEKPKVQSLEEMVQEMVIEQTPMAVPLESPPVSAPKTARRHKSISDFRESTDGRAIVATFELPEVAKEDIHVSFQRNRLVLAWETRELYEWEEDGVILRELIRTVHHRTLPLPEGTRFQEIRAQMSGRGLILRYPNMRCYRVDGQSRSTES